MTAAASAHDDSQLRKSLNTVFENLSINDEGKVFLPPYLPKLATKSLIRHPTSLNSIRPFFSPAGIIFSTSLH